ncbi:hypothetical protein [Mycobacterium avium]|uniref:Transmembrane protein n=1 Tax=Mycobacterium avium (strain 104) TaxID=243243 RepID=A0A0H3A392_MYCA1|nr:hypothetical protein [Mycobacterium avium]ABK68453.1 conserved hypothetical protein [Mycobacterium avium 104]EUA37374.1 hypothetical protein I549_4107 [Mycobacterium avium subsp. avium 2285 (R)]KDP06404.1 hypothetical protein MAV101_11345 [Mycobacterium avium subsp. hominissuis 101]
MPATLSQIEAWSTEHLIDAAAYWTQTADRWEDAFLTMRNQAQSITWHGAGGDALRQRTGADLSVVSGKADLLRQAAGIARNGASDISAAQRRVLYGVEDALNAGFTVGEDLSVTDTRSTSPAERAARQAQAEAFAADIRLRAEQLDGADTKVSGQLTAATAGLSGGGFAQNSTSNRGGRAQNSSGNGGQPQPGHNAGQPQPATTNHNGVRLVDFTQDNASGPNPPPFAPWDNPDGAPPAPAPVQPGVIPQLEQSMTAPPAPKPGPPASPLPSPSVTPLPNPAAVGPAAAAPAKPPCSPYDATKAILEPPIGMVGILTAVPESLTIAGIPAALTQIGVGTVAVADGLDAADKCLP